MCVLLKGTVAMGSKERLFSFSLSTISLRQTPMYTLLMAFLTHTLKWSRFWMKSPQAIKILCGVTSFASRWVGLICLYWQSQVPISSSKKIKLIISILSTNRDPYQSTKLIKILKGKIRKLSLLLVVFIQVNQMRLMFWKDLSENC